MADSGRFWEILGDSGILSCGRLREMSPPVTIVFVLVFVHVCICIVFVGTIDQ